MNANDCIDALACFIRHHSESDSEETFVAIGYLERHIEHLERDVKNTRAESARVETVLGAEIVMFLCGVATRYRHAGTPERAQWLEEVIDELQAMLSKETDNGL